MADPTYKGQAAASRPSWLGSLFGATTPTYAGQGQSVTSSSWFGGTTPAYKPAPAIADDVSNDGSDCPIPPFAIVVPRPRCDE